MLPTVYGFTWDAGNIIFLGIFYTLLIVILTTLTLAAMRAFRDYKSRKYETLRWYADFHDLPPTARECRHELTGEVKHRTCNNGFDCRTCTAHQAFLAAYDPSEQPVPPGSTVYGFTMPLDRRYHRGHTWVKQEEDGTCTIGLDDFGARLIGDPDSVELPPVGTRLQANGTGWIMKKRGAALRILSPVDGSVVERGEPGRGWFLRVRADVAEEQVRHLLRGAEIRPWIMREMERLQRSLSTDGVGISLADGGVLLKDPAADYPQANWEAVYGEMFLEP